MTHDSYTREPNIMGNRRDQTLIKAASLLMERGEQVELTAIAKLGSGAAAATRTVVATAAAAAVVGIMGGGVGFVGFARREVYIVLTDRQVLFFEAVRSTGGPGKHLASFPRQLAASSEPKSSGLGLFTKFSINVQGLDQPVQLTVPPLPPSNRSRARELADILAHQSAAANMRRGADQRAY
jgi:hypothetical protein